MLRVRPVFRQMEPCCERDVSYVPWRRRTLLNQLPEIDTLLSNSHFPADVDSSLDNPITCAAYESLHSAASCRVCRLLFELAETSELPDAFLEDYALLCYVCLHAPICWSSGLTAAAELCHLLKKHFESQIHEASIFQIGGISGIDIQLHFFINRCFKAIAPEKTYVNANLSFLKLEFLRGGLIGSIQPQLCFKTVWKTLNPEDSDTNGQRKRKRDWRGGSHKDHATVSSPCCSWVRKQPDTGNVIRDAIQPQTTNDKTERRVAQATTDIMIRCWLHSDLLKNRQRLPDAESNELPQYSPPDTADIDKGPCLLAPMVNLKQKNQTFSTCLLCELLSTHPHAKRVLGEIHGEIMTRVLNNMKLIDRINLLMADTAYLRSLIEDETFFLLFTSLTSHEIYKHLFCDPLCILNTLATSPDVLFCEREEGELTRLKQRLAIGDVSLIAASSLPRCDHLESLALIFKSIQALPVQKTTFLDILREVDASLTDHRLSAVQSVQTAHLYV